MKKMGEMKKKATMEKRKAALVEAGISEEDVEESLASFDALEEEAFESVIALMKKKFAKEDEAEAKMPPELKEALEKKKKEKEAKAEDEAESEEVTAETFKEVETTEAALVEADEYDEVEAARASVSDWLSNHVLSNK